ncbi:MAG: hypothetical protein GIKADHBN_02584 [Phycisphaerales bacterium]|nr:hypothetical protein [Phycisphaerales bacterium]
MQQPAESPPTAALVEGDRACVKCSYNLRGLRVDGRCPECGHAVADSLRGTLLEFAAPEYVARVNSGLSLVLTAILLMIISTVLTFLGEFAGSSTGYRAEIALVTSLFALGVSAMGLVGYLRYSTPDPGFIGTERPDASRKVLRTAVIIQASISMLLVVWQSIGMAGMPAGPSASMAVALLLQGVGTVAWLVQFVSVMNYTNWIARRVPDHYIMKRTRLYRWLLPVLSVVGAAVFFLGPLVALIMYWNLLDRLRKHTRSIVRTGQPARLRRMINPDLLAPDP